MQLIRSYALWTMYSLGSLLVCVWMAWHLTAQANFFYPTWYSVLDINQTIEQTMPKHLYKKNFVVTDQEEHFRLFAEIVNAIQNRGRGLEEIVYYSPQGNLLGQLLTENEIIHLQDVANLVNLLGWYSIAFILMCLIILSACIFFRIRMPAFKQLCYSMIATVLVCSLSILMIGAKQFFYWLHTVVFPKNHQWFFYYEESLMSTLMKAPDLFAPISVLIIVVGMIIWIIHIFLIKQIRWI